MHLLMVRESGVFLFLDPAHRILERQGPFDHRCTKRKNLTHLQSILLFKDSSRSVGGYLSFIENAQHEYTVEAWEDDFKSWQVEYAKKYGAGNLDLTELDEGSILGEKAAARAKLKRSNRTKSDCLHFQSN